MNEPFAFAIVGVGRRWEADRPNCARYKVRPVRSNLCGSFAAASLAIAVAGCGITKQPDPPPAVDPNLYPQNYRKQIAIYLSQELMDRADFRGARISPPMLKQAGDTAHYVVCVQFNGHSEIKNKVAFISPARSTSLSIPRPTNVRRRRLPAFHRA